MSSPEQQQQQLSCDVAIIGAGVSGLAAASRLLKSRPQLNVLVLEASSRVGGRLLTKQVRCADGQSRGWCFGGSSIGKTHRRSQDLIKELGLTTCEVVKPPGKSILEIGDTVDRYEGDTPNLGTLALLDLDRSFKSLDKQSKTLMENRGSWAALAAMSLAKKIAKESWKEATRRCLTAILEPFFDGAADQISSLQALRIANSAGGLNALLEDAEGLRVVQGAQAICTSLANRLGPDRVLLSRRVTELDQSDSASVRITCSLASSGEQQVVTARFALLTLPLSSLPRLRFAPDPLPPAKRTLAEASAPLASSESTVVAVATYREAFWRRGGCSGDLLSHLGSPVPGSRHPIAPVAVAADASLTLDGGREQQPALVLVTGYSAEYRWPTPEARQADCLAHLARFFPDEEVAAFVDFVEHDWGTNDDDGAAVMGASPLPAGGTAATDRFYMDAAALAEPLGRVHFAGTDFAAEWIGSIEGAVESADRAVGELLERLRRSD